MQTQLMPSLFQRVTFTLSFLALSTLALAQSKTDAPRKKQIDWNKPIAVASIASIDRVLHDIDYMFSTIDKPEFPAMLKGFLAQYRNLEGIDKTRPLGVFVFLKEGISPQPEVVGYIPIQDLDALKQTLEEVGFFLNPVEGKEDRYTLALPAFTLHLKLAHDYAFVQIKSEALDRNFYNPDEFTSALAEKYDIAASIFLKNIPEPMRMMVVDLTNARMEQQLQKKPDEMDIQFESRKATTQMLQKQYETCVKQGEQVILGFNISKQKKQIQLHLGIKASPDSDLGKEFQRLSHLSSHYAYLDGNSSDYLGYAVLPVRKNVEQKLFLEVLEKSKADVPPVLLGDKDHPGPVAKMLDSIKATIQSGKLDAQLQMLPTSKGKPALIASVKLSEGDQFRQGQQELIELLESGEPAPEFKANVAEINGVTVHQITPPDSSPKARELFGEQTVVFVGSSPDELWVTVGQVEALEQLKAAISRNNDASKKKKGGNIFLVSIKFNPLLTMIESSAKDRDFVETAKVAFASGGDLMTFYPKITADEASLNLDFGEGFIRLFSLAFANAKP